MSAWRLAGRVTAALRGGAPIPDEWASLPVAWVHDVAPGDNDGIDEPHMRVEVAPLFGRVFLHVIEFADCGEQMPGAVVAELTGAHVAALRERWSALFAWPYNNELEEVAA